MMKYKGYQAKFTVDEDHDIFHGEVLGLTDVVTFQGSTVVELKGAFQESVDDYLDFCKERGEEPEKPFSGRFVVRMSPDLHRACVIAAKHSDKSLNAWVASTLSRVVDRDAETVSSRERPMISSELPR
jgi:predicted HicB family RNase H-like nuclease